MPIVTTLEYGRYKVCLSPAPDPLGNDPDAVADAELTIYDPADTPILLAEARGNERQMKRYAGQWIDAHLPDCPCSPGDTNPVKPGYKLCWACMDSVAANGEDERLWHS